MRAIQPTIGAFPGGCPPDLSAPITPHSNIPPGYEIRGAETYGNSRGKDAKGRPNLLNSTAFQLPGLDRVEKKAFMIGTGYRKKERDAICGPSLPPVFAAVSSTSCLMRQASMETKRKKKEKKREN